MPASKVGGRTCGEPECRAELNRRTTRRIYAANPDARRAASAAYRAARTPEQIERDRAAVKARVALTGYTEAKRAGDARRRARKRAATVESFTHVEIFERDGWRCGICGRRINRQLAYPHPRSVSLDHVIPLALNGTHTRANVRAAHLDCNVIRGAARSGADQLALV